MPSERNIYSSDKLFLPLSEIEKAMFRLSEQMARTTASLKLYWIEWRRSERKEASRAK